jgi:hypothetical protein
VESDYFMNDPSTGITIYGQKTRVDLNDIDGPIKDQITLLAAYTSPGTIFQIVIGLLFDLVELTKEDGLLGFDPFIEPEHMMSISQEKTVTSHLDEALGNTTFINIKLQLGPDILQYKRKVFNVFELTGILGGIFEVFDVAFGFILGSLSSFMFKKDLREDVIKAEKQYNSLKITIEELKKEVRSNQQPQNLPQEEEKLPNQSNRIADQIDQELHQFTRYRRQRHYQVIDEIDPLMTEDETLNLKQFSKELD